MKLNLSLPQILIFTSILLNINFGLFYDGDTYKLIWMYLIVLPIILISICKIKIQGYLTLFFSIMPIIVSVLSAILQKNITNFFYHDLSVAIMAIIVMAYFQSIDYKIEIESLKILTCASSIIIFIYSTLAIGIMDYNTNVLFGNRNLAANFLVMSLPILIIGSYGSEEKYKNIYRLSIACSIFSILFYFQSRFALVASFFVILFYVFLKIKNLKKNHKYSLLFIILFLIILTSMFYGRFNQLFSYSGYDDRLIVLKIALVAIKENFVFGYGLGATQIVINTYRSYYQDYSIRMDEILFTHLHNEPLQYVIEGGVFAIFFYLLFVGYIFYNAIIFLKNKINLSKDIEILIAVLLAITLGFLHSLVDVTSKSPFNRAYLYLLIGILFSLVKRKNVI